MSGIEQVIGIDTIKLEYSRPNLKGRVLFGEMIPWGSVWRIGANASTKIELSETMFLNGNKVLPGKYSVLCIPTLEGDWTFILNKNTNLWGHYGYNEDEDLIRFPVKPTYTEDQVETLSFNFKNVSKGSADLVMEWGDLKLEVKAESDKESVDRRILASINDKLNDPAAHQEAIVSAHVYFFAADYYHQSGRDLEQALEWINKAVEIKNVNYFHLYKAEILGDLGRFEDALTASKEGLSMFEEGPNEEWKWRYRQQIEKWQKEL